MKKLIRGIAILLTLVMLISAFASCTTEKKPSNSADNGQTEDPNGENSGSSSVDPSIPGAENFPENSFPIFAEGTYATKVVISDSASEAVRTVSTKLRGVLKAKTKENIDASTDYLKSGESYDPDAYEIIVGETNHTESSELYKSTPYNSYGIKTIGRKIVFYFTNLDEGNTLVQLFSSAIKSNESDAFWVSDTLAVAKISSVELGAVPKYQTSKGSVGSPYDCDGDTSLILVKNTNLEEFNTYCKAVVASGYTEYSKRDNVDGNYFYVFTKEHTALSVHFCKGRAQTRIIVGPDKDIPSKEIDSTPETVKPSVTMIGPSERTENGLALVYELPNGKFLIIDGGYFLSDRIYKELRELQPNAEKLTIAGWFVSHPHIDHQESLEHFIKLHGNEVDIENIYFNYVKPEYYDKVSSDASVRESGAVIRLQELIDKHLSRTTNIIKPHTGQIYTFGKSTTVEIISTIDDYLPSGLDNINTSSMIVRVTVKGYSTMVLADATSTLKDIILDMYNGHLESDMVTLAHHGIWVDTPEMYKRVSAEVLLWPSNTSRAQEFYHGNRPPSNSTYSKATIREALNQATDVFLARGTDTKLSLPYTPVGNKQDFINNVLN